jgi:hypothetical protein
MQHPRPPSAPKVFFPRQERTSPSGYLVGWNPHSFLCTVATVTSSVPLSALDQALALIASDPELQPLISHCGSAPSVLGVWLHAGDDERRVPMPSERAQTAELWLSLVGEQVNSFGDGEPGRARPTGLAEALPALRDIHCCGCRYRASLQLIFFERAAPGALDRSELSMLPPWQPFDQGDPMAEGSLLNDSSVSELEYTLRHVSCSGEFERALARALSCLTPGMPVTPRLPFVDIATPPRSALTAGLLSSPQATSEPEPYSWRRLGAIPEAIVAGCTELAHSSGQLWQLGLTCLTQASALFAGVLHGEAVASCSIVGVSLTARHLEARLAAFCSWPRRWQVLRAHPHRIARITPGRARGATPPAATASTLPLPLMVAIPVQALRRLPRWQQKVRSEWMKLQCEVAGAIFDCMLGILIAAALWQVAAVR